MERRRGKGLRRICARRVFLSSAPPVPAMNDLNPVLPNGVYSLFDFVRGFIICNIITEIKD